MVWLGGFGVAVCGCFCGLVVTFYLCLISGLVYCVVALGGLWLAGLAWDVPVYALLYWLVSGLCFCVGVCYDCSRILLV